MPSAEGARSLIAVVVEVVGEWVHLASFRLPGGGPQEGFEDALDGSELVWKACFQASDPCSVLQQHEPDISLQSLRL